MTLQYLKKKKKNKYREPNGNKKKINWQNIQLNSEQLKQLEN